VCGADEIIVDPEDVSCTTLEDIKGLTLEGSRPMIWKAEKRTPIVMMTIGVMKTRDYSATAKTNGSRSELTMLRWGGSE